MGFHCTGHRLDGREETTHRLDPHADRLDSQKNGPCELAELAELAESNESNERHAQRALLWALALNGGFLVVEAVAGWTTGSLALLSDAAHMASDVSVLAAALGTAWFACRMARAGRHGLCKRAELLGGLLSGIVLLVVSGAMLFEAVERLQQGSPVIPAWPVLVVGMIGLGINLGSAWPIYRAYRAGAGGLNMRGALLHMLADAGGSAAAVIASLFLFAGVAQADAVVSMVIAALVSWAGCSLIRDAARALLALAAHNLGSAHIPAAPLDLEHR